MDVVSYYLTLPYPPSNNHYKGIVRNPKHPKISRKTGKPMMRFWVSPQTVKYQKEVALRFLLQNGKRMFSKKLRVEIDVYPPDARKRDLDNVPKVVLDALQKAGAFDNDYSVHSLHIERKEKIEGGQLKVRISAM